MPFGWLMSAFSSRLKEVKGAYSPVLVAVSVPCFIGGAISPFMRQRRYGRSSPMGIDKMETGAVTP
jgi:hypothetical protein